MFTAVQTAQCVRMYCVEQSLLFRGSFVRSLPKGGGCRQPSFLSSLWRGHFPGVCVKGKCCLQ